MVWARQAVLILAFVASSGGLVPSLAQGSGPSFDCGRASTSTERAICSVPRLAQADRELAAVYRRMQDWMPVEELAALTASQRSWLARRERVCGAGRDAACLAEMYAERTAYLRARLAGAGAPEAGSASAGAAPGAVVGAGGPVQVVGTYAFEADGFTGRMTVSEVPACEARQEPGCSGRTVRRLRLATARGGVGTGAGGTCEIDAFEGGAAPAGGALVQVTFVDGAQVSTDVEFRRRQGREEAVIRTSDGSGCGADGSYVGVWARESGRAVRGEGAPAGEGRPVRPAVVAAGPGLLEEVSGFWAIGGVAACARSAYEWTVVEPAPGAVLSFRDRAGRVNLERVHAQRADGFTTSTVTSRDVPLGTIWDYARTGPGAFMVRNLSTTQGFMLVRCAPADQVSGEGGTAGFADPVALVGFLIGQSGRGFSARDEEATQSVFSPGLRAALRASFQRSRVRNEPPCGANGDVVLGTQEGGAARNVRLSRAVTAADRVTVTASFEVDGYRRERRYMAVSLGEEGWKVENIVDADGTSLRRSLDCR